MRPRIGITPDLVDARLEVAAAYARAVTAVGGTPIVLVPDGDLVPSYLELCDGFVLSGGDDPDMTQWGVPLHPAAKPVAPERQRFEWALLEAVAGRERPTLGVCLGMQMMGLHAGGVLDQHLPDGWPTAADHWGRKPHRVVGSIGSGTVHSHHRQAIVEPGRLEVIGRADDGLIEAIRDPDRRFHLGVQWHPERTDDPALGLGLFAALVRAAEEIATC